MRLSLAQIRSRYETPIERWAILVPRKTENSLALRADISLRSVSFLPLCAADARVSTELCNKNSRTTIIALARTGDRNRQLFALVTLFITNYG